MRAHELGHTSGSSQTGMVRWPVLLLLGAVVALGAWLGYEYAGPVVRRWSAMEAETSGAAAKPADDAPKTTYACPMHPEVTSDKRDRCPKCGMFLEPVKGEGAVAPKAETPAPPPANKAAKKAKYHCPMHPTYVSARPGECPICGMNLVPIQETGEMKGTGIPGHAPVRIAPEMQQLIGVKTAKVERRRVNKTIRAVGLVGYDETKLATVTLRYSGWIEKLFVNYTGQLVQKGEPLATIYSPDLVPAQNEYLIALDAAERAKQGGRSEDIRGAEGLLAAARAKLALYDLTGEQIAELGKSRTPQTYVTLHSPIKGYVTQRNVVKQSFMAMGQELYEISDLSTVWVNADVYEYEIPQVQLDQEAVFELLYEPGMPYRGKVIFIFPFLDKETRSVRVRLEFPNPDLKLKPQMYGNATIMVDLGDQLVVDDSAIMFTGTEQVAFVSLGDGYFEPRKVTIGPYVTGAHVVRDGLKAGESVVVGANFLVDSESRLKAALMTMGAPTEGGEGAPAMPGHKH